MVMKRLSEYVFFWTLGGTLYYSFEMIFRGFSHWSMFMLAGSAWFSVYNRAFGRDGIRPSGFRFYGAAFL